MTNTSRFGLPQILTNQAQKEVTHNEALFLIDALLHLELEDNTLNAPPGAPQLGQCWIVAGEPGAVGEWNGQVNNLAIFTPGGWRFVTPRRGTVGWLKPAGQFIRYGENGWEIGTLSVSTIEVDGLQRLGGGLPGITNPVGGETIDAEARAVLSALLNALENHGLIATDA